MSLSNISSPFDILFSTPIDQLVLIGAAALILVIGSEYVFRSHGRRTGKPQKLIGNPFSDFMDFNKKEWMLFLSVQIVGVFIVIAALSLNKA
jgi:hypothetical protein